MLIKYVGKLPNVKHLLGGGDAKRRSSTPVQKP
jgi:hypothetical protein